MASPRPRSPSVGPPRAAAGIWISYLLVLVVADYTATRAGASTGLLPTPYYISQLLIALCVLALSISSSMSARLGPAFLPLVILMTAALPLMATAMTVPVSFPGPLTGVEGTITLRSLPMLTVAVVLIAWQYRMRHVLLFCLGTAALFVLLHSRSPSSLLRGVTIAAVQGTGFLVLGYCVSLVMDKLRTQQASLEQANVQLRHYASTLEHLAMSRERNRVARELHDTLAHTLSGMIVQLEATKAYWEADPQAVGPMIQTALDNTRLGLQETRRALKALRASPLDELGLRQALYRLGEQAAAAESLRLDCSIAADLPVLSPDIEQCIYRVAQEAIANVTHHANARSLWVHLSYSRGRMELVVQDDGRGFEQVRPAGDGHFGLAGMDERAALSGGRLTIASTPGEGTTVTLTF